VIVAVEAVMLPRAPPKPTLAWFEVRVESVTVSAG
jgi:hypothetical protein